MAKKPRLPSKLPVATTVPNGSPLGGAPTKFTPERIKTILEARAELLPIHKCAWVAGVSYDRVNEWLKRGEDAPEGDPYRKFYEDFKIAEANGIRSRLANIARHGKENWQADAWTLERCFPDLFGRFDRSQPAGNVNVLVLAVVSELKRLLPDPQARMKFAEALEGGMTTLPVPEGAP